MSPMEIESMDYNDFNSYYDAIEEIRGSEMLLMIDVVSYPHASKSTQQKIIKKFSQFKEKKHGTTKDIMAIIGGMKNGR